MTSYVIGPDVATRLAQDEAVIQADALITLDRRLAHEVKDLVTVAPIEALL